MLHGRVCEAVHFVTDRARGGVLKPSDLDAKSDKCVFDVLRETPSPWLGFSGCICIMFRSTFAC